MSHQTFFLTMIIALLQALPALATCESKITPTRPDDQYIDNQDGTVTDTKTGLMWQKCSIGETLMNNSCEGISDGHTFDEALEIADMANVDTGTLGYQDWRLPTIIELRTLMDKACYNPTINTTFFPTTLGWYWSSSAFATFGPKQAEEKIRVMNFTLGFEATSKKNVPTFIKLVRREKVGF